MSIGSKIREYMDSKGIKQVHVVELTGLSPQKLNRILKGEQEPKVSDYELICGALEVELNKFSSPRIIQQG